MNRKRLRLLAGSAMVGAMLLTSSLSAGANELINVGIGVATVDGDTADWDLDDSDGASDFIAAMYRSGGSDKDVIANLYGKVDGDTLYLLALSTEHVVDMSGPEVWVAFNSNDNKVFPAFEPVLDGDLNVVGWEAAVTLPEDGVTSINVHTNWDNGQTGALARGNGLIDFTVVEPPLEEEVCVEYTGAELAELMADGGTTVEAGEAVLAGIPEDACEFELTFTSYDLPGGDIEPSEDQVVFDTTETLTVSAENNGDLLEVDIPDCVWLTSLYTGELVESGQLVDDIVINWDATTMTAEELAVCNGDEIIDDEIIDDEVIDDEVIDDEVIDEDEVIVEDDEPVVEVVDTEDVTVVESDEVVAQPAVDSADVLGVQLEEPAPAPQVEASGELAATGMDTGTLLWLAMLAGLIGAGLVTSTRRFDVG